MKIVVLSRFKLIPMNAGNGEAFATGEGHKNEQGCFSGIKSIKKNAPDAEIVEVD